MSMFYTGVPTPAAGPGSRTLLCRTPRGLEPLSWYPPSGAPVPSANFTVELGLLICFAF